MKAYLKARLLLLLLVITCSSNAQKTFVRPKLFARVDNKITYPKEELEKIFTKTKGSIYQISLPGNFNFSGTIVSSVQRYDNLKSFLIKSALLNGTMFAISKRINDDKSVTYVGRIINEKYSDGYELKQDAGGNYFLNKIDMDEVIGDH